MGAAIVDMTLILGRAVKRWRETAAAGEARRRRRGPWLAARPHRAPRDLVDAAGARRSSPSVTSCCSQPVLYLVVAARAGVRVRARQRHLARHQRLEPDLVGVRRLDRHPGGDRPEGSDRRPDGRHRAARLDQRRLRHAAGPLDRRAPRHQPRHAVPLPGGRHLRRRAARGRLRHASSWPPIRCSCSTRRR